MRCISITPPATPTFQARLADNLFSRFLGLMGQELFPGDALLLSPCSQIHCFFMKSAIDAVYLSSEGEILALTASMKPGSVGNAVRGAKMVLELWAGDALRLGLRPGQYLTIGERVWASVMRPY